MSQARNALCAILIALFVMPSAPAVAWSEGGHHIIALMAFRLLSKEEQASFIAIFEHHPRFSQDFTPPKGLPNEDENRNWRVGRAGYWPDVARSQPEFNRPTWHYELGAALAIGDAATVKPPERPGPLPTDATMKTQELHISQALELCKKTLANKSKPDSDRALAICWLAHLVADSHQPCHAGSLYMEKVFTEADGDRGANRILLKQRGNLHALWDQLLGEKFTLNGTNKRIAEITADADLVDKAKQSIETAQGLDPQIWLAESRKSAIENVYTPEVLDSLRLVSRGIVKKPEPIELSELYLKNAGRVAQVRAIEAAYRLAETWRSSLH
jgi:S1/P1 Nuclease